MLFVKLVVLYDVFLLFLGVGIRFYVLTLDFAERIIWSNKITSMKVVCGLAFILGFILSFIAVLVFLITLMF